MSEELRGGDALYAQIKSWECCLKSLCLGTSCLGVSHKIELIEGRTSAERESLQTEVFLSRDHTLHGSLPPRGLMYVGAAMETGINGANSGGIHGSLKASVPNKSSREE